MELLFGKGLFRANAYEFGIASAPVYPCEICKISLNALNRGKRINSLPIEKDL